MSLKQEKEETEILGSSNSQEKAEVGSVSWFDPGVESVLHSCFCAHFRMLVGQYELSLAGFGPRKRRHRNHFREPTDLSSVYVYV